MVLFSQVTGSMKSVCTSTCADHCRNLIDVNSERSWLQGVLLPDTVANRIRISANEALQFDFHPYHRNRLRSLILHKT